MNVNNQLLGGISLYIPGSHQVLHALVTRIDVFPHIGIYLNTCFSVRHWSTRTVIKGAVILFSLFMYNRLRDSRDDSSKAGTTVYPKKYAHGFCFAVLCCGYTLADLPISIRLTSLALWQSNDCPSASKATLMNMDKYFMWIHYERLHNHNKAKHNKTVCIFLGIPKPPI